MTHILVCVRNVERIFDFSLHSREMALVVLENGLTALGVRRDLCTQIAQFFFIQLTPSKRFWPGIGPLGHRALPACPLLNQPYLRTSCWSCESEMCLCGEIQPKQKYRTSNILANVINKAFIELPADVAFHAFREIQNSAEFRTNFFDYVRRVCKFHNMIHYQCRCANVMEIFDTVLDIPYMIEVLVSPAVQQVSYAWSRRMDTLVYSSMLRDEALAWLSTLGGGFSALGDYFHHHSLIAGKISIKQLRLALDIGDPVLAAKCRLFYALSQMQRGKLRESKHIIRYQYHWAKQHPLLDEKLLSMCKGVWSKLQYSYKTRNRNNTLTQS